MASLRKTTSRLAGGGLVGMLGWGLINQATVSATGFLATVLVGRFCGPSKLGIYALGLSLAYLALGAQDALISSPYTIYANRLAPDARRRYTGSTLLQSCLFSLAMTELLAVTAVVGQVGIGPTWLAAWSWSLAVLLPASLLRQFGRKLAFADHCPGRATLIDGTVMVLQLAGVISLAAAGRLDVVSAYAVITLACLVATVLWLALYHSSIELDRSQWSADLSLSWSLGKWVLASRLVSVINAYAIHWLLVLVSDIRATGIFAACISVVSISNLAVFGLGNVLEPRMAQAWSQGGLAKIRQVEQRTTLLLSVVMGAFFLALLVSGDDLLQLLYRVPDYANQSHAIFVLAAAAFIDALGVGASQALRVMEKPQANVRANAYGLVATLAIATVAIPNSAVLGGAYALLVGNLVTTIVRFIAYWRYVFVEPCESNLAGLVPMTVD